MTARVEAPHSTTTAAYTSTATFWWLLRVAAALCFIGHGAFGILRKEAWLSYFAIFGIGSGAAYDLMPLVGTVDIALGILILIRPAPAIAAYMAFWGVWTAMLRPLAGEPVWETLERAGNYGVPLALLLLMLPLTGLRDWFAAGAPRPLSADRLALLQRVLVWTTALLLVGHGALGVQGKELLVGHYTALGIGSGSAVLVTPLVGWLEIGAGVALLIRPSVLLAIAACGWKLATEALFLVDGAPVWEFVERGGSYAAPLGLAMLMMRARHLAPTAARRARSGLAGARATAAVIGALALLAAAPANAEAQRSAGDGARAARSGGSLEPRDLLERLRAGGLVLACRHAATDHDASDNGPARADQRNLTDAGVRQAKAIAAAIGELAIPIGEVRANPMFRNRETAEHAFGRMQVDTTLGGRGAGDALRALLAAPVPTGTNRAIVTRTGVLSAAFDGTRVTRLDEGDCAVVRPSEQARLGFEVLGQLSPGDWSVRRP